MQQAEMLRNEALGATLVKTFLPPTRKLSMYTWQRKTALMK